MKSFETEFLNILNLIINGLQLVNKWTNFVNIVITNIKQF